MYACVVLSHQLLFNSIILTLLLIIQWVVILKVLVFLWMFQHLFSSLVALLFTCRLIDLLITDIFLLCIYVSFLSIGWRRRPDSIARKRRGCGCCIFYDAFWYFPGVVWCTNLRLVPNFIYFGQLRLWSQTLVPMCVLVFFWIFHNHLSSRELNFRTILTSLV